MLFQTSSVKQIASQTALALALTLAGKAQVPASAPAPDWAGDNPYRNFLGTWQGTIPLNPSHDASPVRLTITEDKATASMHWHYAFGTPGQKHYVEDDKVIVLSATAGKMMMHYVKEPRILYDVADLQAFQKTGLGTFVAVRQESVRNYFYVRHPWESRMTLDLEPSTLTYYWEIEEHGKSRPYSRFEFTRVP